MEGGDAAGARVQDQDARAEEALSRFLPADAPAIVRSHTVTALLVAHDGQEWLARTLAGVARQTRPADRVVAADCGSDDGSRELLDTELSGVLELRGEGVAEALRSASASDVKTAFADAEGDDDVVRWYWILHDDAAPEPACLSELLAGADRHPASHVLIPKTVAWSDRTRLVGIGNMWAPGRPVVERLEPGERDQGQYDVDRQVYGGETAGMLVRADTWRALDGLDSRYDSWGSGADLCRRVWGSGGEVAFIPRAVVAHRQAGRLGVRPGASGRPPPRRAARRGQLLLELTQAPAAALPWRWLRGWLSTLVRALALLLTREPEEAGSELAGAWDALAHPARLRSGRRALRRPPVTSTARPRRVRARRGTVLAHALDVWSAAGRSLGRRPWHGGRSLAIPLATAGVLAVLAIVRDPGQLFGSGSLQGGGLLPAGSAGEVLGAYLASWQDVRFGVPSTQPAYLPLLAAASLPFLGSVDALLRVLVGLAVPLAFLSMYVSLGSGWPVRVRALLALTWSVLPAGVAAMSGGRISTVGLLLLGPPTARLLSSAVSAARGPARLRPSIAAGTMLGLTSAFAPAVLLVVAVAAVLTWGALRLPRWPVRSAVIVLAVAATIVILWVPRVVAAPWLLLTDLGLSDALLSSPQAWVWGLSPGGPNVVAWAGLPLVAVSALLALASPRAPVLAALAGGILLMTLATWSVPLVRSVWPEADAEVVWPGQVLLLAGGLLALVVSLVVARGRSAGARFAGVALVVQAGCLATLMVGWWVAPVTTVVGEPSALPPVVGLASESEERPRALVLTRDGDMVRYGVATGPSARLGDADALAGPAGDPAFTKVVEDLVSGVGGDVEGELGGRAIRFVVLDGSPGDPIADRLDASIGLRRLASVEDQSLWLVSGQPSRVELVGRSDDPDVVVPVVTRPTSVDVILHPQTLLPRILRLAEAADPGWTARVDGAPVVVSADPRGMSVGQVAATGPLVVDHTSPWSMVATAHLGIVLLLVLLALPKRRPPDPQRQGAR